MIPITSQVIDIDLGKGRDETRKKHGLLNRITLFHEVFTLEDLKNIPLTADKLNKIRAEVAFNIESATILMKTPEVSLDEKSEEKLKMRFRDLKAFLKEWGNLLSKKIEEDEAYAKFYAKDQCTKELIFSKTKNEKTGRKLSTLGQGLLNFGIKASMKQVNKKHEVNQSEDKPKNQGSRKLSDILELGEQDGHIDNSQGRDTLQSGKLNFDMNMKMCQRPLYTPKKKPKPTRNSSLISKNSLTKKVVDSSGTLNNIKDSMINASSSRQSLPNAFVPINKNKKESKILSNPAVLPTEKKVPIQQSHQNNPNRFDHVKEFLNNKKNKKFNLEFNINEYWKYLAMSMILFGRYRIYNGKKYKEAIRFFEKAANIMVQVDESLYPDHSRILIKAYFMQAKCLEEFKSFKPALKMRWKIFEFIKCEYSLRMNPEVMRKNYNKQKYKIHSLAKYAVFNLLSMAGLYYDIGDLCRTLESLNTAFWFAKSHFNDKNPMIADIIDDIYAFRENHYELVIEKCEFERILHDHFYYETLPLLEEARFLKKDLGVDFSEDSLQENSEDEIPAKSESRRPISGLRRDESRSISTYNKNSKSDNVKSLTTNQRKEREGSHKKSDTSRSNYRITDDQNSGRCMSMKVQQRQISKHQIKTNKGNIIQQSDTKLGVTKFESKIENPTKELGQIEVNQSERKSFTKNFNIQKVKSDRQLANMGSVKGMMPSIKENTIYNVKSQGFIALSDSGQEIDVEPHRVKTHMGTEIEGTNIYSPKFALTEENDVDLDELLPIDGIYDELDIKPHTYARKKSQSDRTRSLSPQDKLSTGPTMTGFYQTDRPFSAKQNMFAKKNSTRTEGSASKKQALTDQTDYPPENSERTMNSPLMTTTNRNSERNIAKEGTYRKNVFKQIDGLVNRVDTCEAVMNILSDGNENVLNPRTLLKFKKQIDFKVGYQPTLTRETNYWWSQEKAAESRNNIKKDMKDKFSMTYMTTRQAEIRRKAPKTKIKAFNNSEILECDQGDCDRYFKVDIKENLNRICDNKELDAMKGEFIYRLRLDDKDKKDTKFCERMLNMKAPEFAISGENNTDIDLLADIALDANVFLTKEDLLRKEEEKIISKNQKTQKSGYTNPNDDMKKPGGHDITGNEKGGSYQYHRMQSRKDFKKKQVLVDLIEKHADDLNLHNVLAEKRKMLKDEYLIGLEEKIKADYVEKVKNLTMEQRHQKNKLMIKNTTDTYEKIIADSQKNKITMSKLDKMYNQEAVRTKKINPTVATYFYL